MKNASLQTNTPIKDQTIFFGRFETHDIVEQQMLGSNLTFLGRNMTFLIIKGRWVGGQMDPRIRIFAAEQRRFGRALARARAYEHREKLERASLVAVP